LPKNAENIVFVNSDSKAPTRSFYWRVKVPKLGAIAQFGEVGITGFTGQHGLHPVTVNLLVLFYQIGVFARFVWFIGD